MSAQLQKNSELELLIKVRIDEKLQSILFIVVCQIKAFLGFESGVRQIDCTVTLFNSGQFCVICLPMQE